MGIPFEEPAAGLNGRSPGELAAAVQSAIDGAGVTFGAKGDERFRIDPVPRVIAAAEWAGLEAGLAQRVRGRSTRSAPTPTASAGSSARA